MKHFAALICFVMAGCAMQKPLSIPAPTQKAEALPTPTTPLRQITGLVGTVPANTPEVLDLYTRSFDLHVFETEYNGSDPYIRKWNKDVIVGIENTIPKWRDAVVRRAMDLLSSITGLVIQYPDAESKDLKYWRVHHKTNVWIYVEPNKNKDICSGIRRKYEDGTIKTAKIFISRSYSAQGNFETCVIEELSQLLGPGNDTDVVESSAWRPLVKWSKKAYERLTYHDAIILRTLYDFRIKPGMPRAQALPIARRIIGELLAELNP